MTNEQIAKRFKELEDKLQKHADTLKWLVDMEEHRLETIRKAKEKVENA